MEKKGASRAPHRAKKIVLEKMHEIWFTKSAFHKMKDSKVVVQV
jgi:hypothetical protein